MKSCSVIQDLLPLYLDGEVSLETRKLVEEHLRGCEVCLRCLESLKTPVPMPPEEGSPSEEARFLHRLRRQVGTWIGIALVLTVVVGVGAVSYGRSARDREIAREMQAQRVQESEAIQALRQLSPDPMKLLQSNGLELETAAARAGDKVTIHYQVSPQEIRTYERLRPLTMGGPEFSLHDPGTGDRLGSRTAYVTASGDAQTGQWTGDVTISGVPSRPVRVALRYSILGVYKPVEPRQQWEIRRPSSGGTVPLGAVFAVDGVEFEVTQVVFTRDKVRVEYRQLTDPAQVGFHYLNFRLEDGMGGNWASDQLVDSHPQHPFQEFTVYTPSKDWRLTAEYAVLALPGPDVTVDIE